MSDSAPRPAKVLRLLVSVLILAYFAAVLATVTGIGSGRFSPPEICAEAATLVRPLLQTLNLDSAHRYYVPNPGAEPVLWIRSTHSSGRGRWLEWPTKRGSSSGLAHTRNLLVPQTISQRDTRKTVRGDAPLTPPALLLLASYSRYLSDHYVLGGDDGHPDPIATIQFYSIDHDLITPPQIRAGMDFLDLRLRRITYIGTYSSSGDKLGVSLPTSVSTVELVARMIEQEIAPALRQADDSELQTTVLNKLGVPAAVVRLLQRQPLLVNSSGDELQQQLRVAVAANDNPQAPLRPLDDYREEWNTHAAGRKESAR